MVKWHNGRHSYPLMGANAVLVRLAEVPPCLQASLLVRGPRCLQLLCCQHSTRCCITSPSLCSKSRPSAGAIWELHELVRKARGDRHNCEQLDLFCQDVMRVLDIAGAHLSDIDGLRLAKLLEHVEAGIELVDACSRSGALGSRLSMCHSCGVPLALRVGGRRWPPGASGSCLGVGGG